MAEKPELTVVVMLPLLLSQVSFCICEVFPHLFFLLPGYPREVILPYLLTETLRHKKTR